MYIYIYIYTCVKDKNINIKRTHRKMARLWLIKDRPGLSSARAPHRDRTTNSRPTLLKRKQYLVTRPQSGLDTKVILALTLSARGYNWATLLLGDIIREPDPPGWGVSDEKVKYGYGFCATRTIEWLQCKFETRPPLSESALQIQSRNFQTATFRQEVICGRKSHKDALTDWPSLVK
jgi:hypothetical protein